MGSAISIGHIAPSEGIKVIKEWDSKHREQTMRGGATGEELKGSSSGSEAGREIQ